MFKKYNHKIEKINNTYIDMIERSLKFILLNQDTNSYEQVISKEKLNYINNKKFQNTEKIKEKAPSSIKEFKPGWLYYAIYTKFDLHYVKNIKNINNKEISLILQICIEFHNKFNEHFNDIIDKSITQSANKTGNKTHDISSCIQVETQFIVRVIEYLIFFSKNSELSKIYLENIKTKTELLQKFQNIISNEYLHKNYFFMISSNLLFLKNTHLLTKYTKEELQRKSENKSNDIFYFILSSRKCSLSKNFIENLISASYRYQDFIKNGISINNNIKSNKNKKTNIMYTNISNEKKINFKRQTNLLKNLDETQEKIKNNIDRTSRPTESFAVALQDKELKTIKSAKAQFNTSISVSANILKERSFFQTYYTIPYILELKDFFQNVKIERNSKSERFLILFLFSLITGSEIIQTIDIINGNDQLKRSDGNSIIVKINEEIFAKYDKSNTFFEKSNFQIEYQLAPELKEIFQYIKKNIDDYNIYIKNHNNKDNDFNIYKAIKLELFDKYEKQININMKQISKINLTHQLSLFENIYTSMFCVAKYNKTDEAKIAYASSKTKNIAYSIFQSKYIEALNLNNCIKRVFSDFKIAKTMKYVTSEDISGSFLSISYTNIRKFINILLDIINNESDQNKRFNFISLYVRFCLTFLNGTRFYIKSSNINNLSLENSIQIINEKAETNLAGIRLIGLSNISINIIKKYIEELNMMKQLDNVSDINFDNFVKIKIKNNKYKTYNIESARYVCKLLPMDKKRKFLEDFIESVPTNTGRHIMTKLFIEKNLNQSFLETFLGHYIKSAEHTGIYSTLSIEKYKNIISNVSENIGISTGIKLWK